MASGTSHGNHARLHGTRCRRMREMTTSPHHNLVQPGQHLVVHDIGGPVGFEIAAAMPERIRSITLLNTMIEAAEFHRPWMMEPFARPGVGELRLTSMSKPVFRQLMYYAGVRDRSATPPEELDA
jgi:pimeloyl-ACP methyl ester carboxylesterase